MFVFAKLHFLIIFSLTRNHIVTPTQFFQWLSPPSFYTKKEEASLHFCRKDSQKATMDGMWSPRHIIYFIFVLSCFDSDVINKRKQQWAKHINKLICVGFSWFTANYGGNNHGWRWSNDGSSITNSTTRNSLPCAPRCWSMWCNSEEAIFV
jgi:hypothetical protein